MFRKVAIALLAASVLTAPALAEIVAPAKAPQTTTGTAPANAANTGAGVKTVKADKAPTKHRKVARHHHHGAKVAMHKQVKHVNVAHQGKGGKMAGTGKTVKHAVKHAAKPATTKPATTNGAAVNTAPAQVTAKPATKSGVN
jgi:hypothetical protein